MTETPIPTPGFNGCEWPIDPACLDEEWQELETDVKARAQALASSTLRRLTGYRVGGCPITVRPCKVGCSRGLLPSYFSMAGPYGLSWYPVNYAGVWINSCGCTSECSCVALCEVWLPPPVGAVYSVDLNGTEVTDYRVDGNTLVYTGPAECPWPTCQDMSKDTGEDGTFSVTYLNSYPVDQLGAYACGVLAMEYAQACVGNACRLPVGVTSVVRQGVSFEVTTGAFPGGSTGIREVDSYIALWNPDGIRRGPTVWSPDKPTVRVTR